jgi:hypothetical protein
MVDASPRPLTKLGGRQPDEETPKIAAE